MKVFHISVYFLKTLGLDNIANYAYALLASTLMYFAWIGDLGESYGFSRNMFVLTIFSAIFDSIAGTWVAIYLGEFEWRKLLKIVNKILVLFFVLVLTSILISSSKNGENVFQFGEQKIDYGLYGAGFAMSMFSVSEIRSAIKSLRKVSENKVLKLLDIIFSLFDYNIFSSLKFEKK